MSFAKLKELIGDNSEALEIVKGLETNSLNNVETINKLEKQVSSITETRDKYKAGNSLVKTMLGLENVNEDTLTDYLNNSKGKNADEKLTLEIENLKSQLSASNDKFNELQQSANGTIRELKLGDTLNNLVGNLNFVNENARLDAINSIKSQISYDEDNNPIFKQEDGTTRFNANSEQFGFNDALNEVISNKPYLFLGDVQSGSDAGGNSGNSNTSADFGGSREERENAIAQKYGIK